MLSAVPIVHTKHGAGSQLHNERLHTVALILWRNDIANGCLSLGTQASASVPRARFWPSRTLMS